MNILILYFSGTGNTEYIARKISLLLNELDFKIEMHSIEENFQIQADQYDMLILGCPKYYEYPALNFVRFLKENLPGSKKIIPTFMFCTQAGSLKTNFNKIDKMLKEKNYCLTVSRSFAVANNMVILESFSMTSEDKIQSNLNMAEEELKPLIADFIKGEMTKEEPTFFYRTVSYLSGRLFTKLFPLFGVKYSASDQCTGCGLCAQKCPSKNIVINNKKPEFHKQCIFCMRCINICPNQAILYNHKQCKQYKRIK